MRYSPLDQIGPDNVGDLQVAWQWSARNLGPEPEFRMEVTPLAVKGILYATAGARRGVVAIDGATGETLWTYRIDEGERGRSAPRRGSGRGVAYWTDGSSHRVFFLTPGYRLIALDASTGTRAAEFGQDGIVDLMEWTRGNVAPEGRIGASSPPLVVGDVVVVGAALEGGLRPPSRANVPGDVHGIDSRTGRRLWSFHTVPDHREPGIETWGEGSADYTGNAGVWAPISADAELDYVYLPVEAPTSDLYGGHRPGDNLFSTSLVCLVAETGELVWHQQLVHHDIWDYDTPAAPILADVTVEGRSRKVVVQLTKQAFAYVFDRVTGEPIWPMEERPVPKSDVPGERTSPTQPFPSRPAPFDHQGFSEDLLIDFTPELRAEAREAVEAYRMGELFQPASLADAADGTRGTLVLPGTLGGANWEGGALDPETGVLFVGSATQPVVLALAHDPEGSDVDYVQEGSMRTPRVQGLPIVKPPWGRITAIDLTSGEHLWQIANSSTPDEVRSHPALAGLNLPRTGRPSRAGLLVTRTLLLAGEGPGGSPVLRAHDKATGEILAEVVLPAAQTGLPMTYVARDRQYVVLAVGGPDQPAHFVALTLPEE
jgi:quinoprotein glucose dehydrogenase